jgi:hypothetical protein
LARGSPPGAEVIEVSIGKNVRKVIDEYLIGDDGFHAG